MSYAVIDKFTHGEILVSADLQQLDDNLDAVYAVLGDAAQFRSAAALVGAEDEDHWFVHRYRWLWYKGDGTISIPALSVNDEALTDSDSPTRLDLRQYKMPVGTLYKISDCVWALETRDP
jgi:hypothetical protein